MPKHTLRLNLTFKFLAGTGAVLVTTLGILFFVLVQRQERLIYSQIENEAKVIFRQIVLTRAWIADHGGVFVEKLSRTGSLSAGDEITDEKGRRFERKTPAMVTKELAKYAKGKGLYWFHITSLKLVNPENAPDAFERESLVAFEKGTVTEQARVESIDRARFFRYIAPLHVESACLPCHGTQGYKIGDIRGAISVTIPMDEVFGQLRSNRVNMLIVGILTTVVLLTALYLMMNGMVLSPLHRLNSSINAFGAGVNAPEAVIRTGDELEELSNSFVEMARTLTKYHTTLEDRIKSAVSDLEETNRRLTEANRRLVEIDRKKSDFVAKASHELRTPLTAIKGAMDYLSVRLRSIAHDVDRKGDAEDLTRLDDLLTFFDIIKKNAERLIRMVNGLLDLERIEQGRSEMHFTELELPTLVDEVVKGFHSSSLLDDRKIVVESPVNLSIHADEDRIRQVLINLLSNAMKYSPEGSSIFVRSARRNGSVRVSVTDSGPGIPPDEQERIFDRFYTLGDKKGTGLGLAISKGIIEAHGGTIGVVSDGKQGSSFFFTLPISGAPQAAE